MQKNNWLRLSLASLVLAGVGAGSVLQGCSDDPVTPASDAGKDTSPTATTPVDANVPDTNVPDTFVPPTPTSQKIIFVHAANYLGPAFESSTGAGAALNGAIRLCLKAGPEGSNPFLPVPALPNKAAAPLPIPALLPGTGGVLPAKTDFSTTRLEGYAMNAQIMAAKGLATGAGANTSCGDLFTKGYPATGDAGDAGGTALVEGVDYIKVGVIDAGTFAAETTYVVSVQGCAKGWTGTVGDAADKCGSTYDAAVGNLSLKVRKVERGTIAGTELGAQFIHATSGANAGGNPLPVNPGVVTNGAADGGLGDAGAFKAFSTAAVAYDGPITAQVKLAGVNLTTDALTMNPALPFPNYSFASAVAATSPSTPIALGKSHVFIAVGETSTAALTGPFDNRKLHFLAFPSDPPVPALEQ